MGRKKSFNPFRIWSSYVWGFFFAATFITLVITSNISFGILDSSQSVCLENCNQLTIDVDLCMQQCGDTVGELGNNIAFFQNLERFKQDPIPITFPYFRFTAESILWIMGLFVAGFVVGWGLGVLKRKIEG